MPKLRILAEKKNVGQNTDPSMYVLLHRLTAAKLLWAVLHELKNTIARSDI